MHISFSPSFLSLRPQILQKIKHFETEGETIYQIRNTVKRVQVGERKFVIKSFKKPNLLNKIAYRYFRPSKARRSFDYAHILIRKKIPTPAPVAYAEERGILFGKSFYVSAHLAYDFSFREAIEMKDGSKRMEIIKQFTRFTFSLHEKGVLFLDHTPGNTLIVDKGGNLFDFYLVDLNRIVFPSSLSLEKRISNFRKAVFKKEDVRLVSETYAALVKRDPAYLFEKLWKEAHATHSKWEKKQKRRP